MIHSELLNDAVLKKLVRIVPEGEYLFKQGERGNTMFIIIEGTVELTQRTLNLVRIVDRCGPGDILGEKAVLVEAPYKRGLTAKALSEVALLEFDSRNLKTVQGKLPNFTLQMLRLVTKRLDKANELIGILQLRDDAERLVQFLLHYCEHNGVKSSHGEEFTVTAKEIHSNINIPIDYIQHTLELLVTHKLLLKKGNAYLLSDETALISFIPSLKERLAA